MLFEKKTEAEEYAIKRRKGFRKQIKTGAIYSDWMSPAKKKKELLGQRQAIKSVKVRKRKLSGGETIYFIDGR